jgi:translocation and assembly module TamA
MMPIAIRSLFFSLVLIALSTAVLWAENGRIDYDVSIEGDLDGGLRETLLSISDTVKQKKERPPVSLRMLERRMERDIPLFIKALRAEGYYGAEVRAEHDDSESPVRAIFKVETGRPYPVESIEIRFVDEGPFSGDSFLKEGELGLKPGDTAKARAILDTEAKILDLLGRRGYPFPSVPDRRVVVDHSKRSVSVSFDVDRGAAGLFGKTTLSGLQSVEEAFVRSRIPWKEGDPFDRDLLTQAQKRIADTGLFAQVTAEPGPPAREEALIPIRIQLTERKHRSVSAGLSYRTDEGIGVQASWEDRNLLGRGEKLALEARYSDILPGLEASFLKPTFLGADHSLRLNLRLENENTDAYDSRNLRAATLVTRRWKEGLNTGAGLAFKASRVEQLSIQEEYRLVYLPIQLDVDRSDDLLHPTRGGRLVLQVAPYQDLLDSGLDFVKGEATVTWYYPLIRSRELIFAARGRLGSIGGASRMEIPADERFYTGGGGSIRGYPYQTVGPMEGTTPTGGKSFVELSGEVRFRVTQSLGLVGFLDGGSAFEDSFPGSGEEILWAAGLGVRYFTPVGPLRLDIAVPLDRREGVDDRFQFYLSLGQAF